MGGEWEGSGRGVGGEWEGSGRGVGGEWEGSGRGENEQTQNQFKYKDTPPYELSILSLMGTVVSTLPVTRFMK